MHTWVNLILSNFTNMLPLFDMQKLQIDSIRSSQYLLQGILLNIVHKVLKIAVFYGNF